MTPVFQSQVVVPLGVVLEEQAMLAAEGPYHVAGRYIPCASDADKMRRIEAERRVAARERKVRLSRQCAWCDHVVTASNQPVELGGRLLHPECADEYDHLVYGDVA